MTESVQEKLGLFVSNAYIQGSALNKRPAAVWCQTKKLKNVEKCSEQGLERVATLSHIWMQAALKLCTYVCKQLDIFFFQISSILWLAFLMFIQGVSGKSVQYKEERKRIFFQRWTKSSCILFGERTKK